ncbi:MAG: hypothetical protein A2X64_09310 [Ignavibacteria bacterium GWF2_33_9]|nr:MAG: hypothetical protein A2X64_09310 [Ignavibacteria bacterium GWF2_33_9]
MESLKRYLYNHKFLLVAHRGSSGTAPENTLAAYSRALSLNVPGIEIDIHQTKDFEIVAFHDDALGRTAEGNKKIEETTLEDLRKLDVGSWFGDEFNSEKIPTLEEILELVGNKAFLIIELKPNNKDPEAFVQNLIRKISKNHSVNKVILVSFDYALLKMAKNINEFFLTAAIKIPGQNILPSSIIENSSADAVICSVDELNDTFVGNAKDNSIGLAVYDVDNEEQLKKALKYQVRGIGTNYPETIIELLRKFEIL